MSPIEVWDFFLDHEILEFDKFHYFDHGPWTFQFLNYIIYEDGVLLKMKFSIIYSKNVASDQ